MLLLMVCWGFVWFFFLFCHQSSKDTRITLIDLVLNHRHDSFPVLQTRMQFSEIYTDLSIEFFKL